MASTCAICCKNVKDATSKTKGEDAVYCEGSCQAWMHRQCIGMSLQVFSGLTQSLAPFYCLYCCHLKISELQNTIKVLEAKLACTDKRDSPSSVNTSSAMSYSSVVQSNLPSDTQPSSKTYKTSQVDKSHRKFNVVVYGIKEKPKGSPKHTRLIQDTNDVSKVFSKIDSSIPAQSIQDCTRLGKYSDSKCRPVLVKLSRFCEASSLLSQRKKLKDTPGVFIKPDMPVHERKVDSILLTKRWEIIQSGTAREHIKLKGNSIFVHNVKIGYVDPVDFTFKDCKVTDNELLSDNPSATDTSQST